MNHPKDRAQRRYQQWVLARRYPDYFAKRHDAFVARFNQDLRELRQRALRRRGEAA